MGIPADGARPERFFLWFWSYQQRVRRKSVEKHTDTKFEMELERDPSDLEPGLEWSTAIPDQNDHG